MPARATRQRLGDQRLCGAVVDHACGSVKSRLIRAIFGLEGTGTARPAVTQRPFRYRSHRLAWQAFGRGARTGSASRGRSGRLRALRRPQPPASAQAQLAAEWHASRAAALHEQGGAPERADSTASRAESGTSMDTTVCSARPSRFGEEEVRRLTGRRAAKRPRASQRQRLAHGRQAPRHLRMHAPTGTWGPRPEREGGRSSTAAAEAKTRGGCCVWRAEGGRLHSEATCIITCI